jgi:oligopeptide/dipeptide ABC transporter ATP-binding protein
VENPGRIVGGKILFKDENLLDKSINEMRSIRGGQIAISFQDPMTFLNPVMRVGDQISEAILIHEDISKEEAFKKTVEVMSLVAIPEAEKRAMDYPHQFSAGMRQRIIIAIALSCQPDLYIADEPTSNLDVIVQAQILEMFKELRRKLNSMMLITHNLGILAELCDRVAIMYAGNLVEYGDVKDIYNNPAHPYTKALFSSIPRVDWGKRKLKTIKGVIPSLINVPPGCKFHPRCEFAKASCKEISTELFKVGKGHYASCPRYKEVL